MKMRNISRQVIFLGIVSFFTDFASEMLYPITPIFLTTVLGASMATVGAIEGIAEITAGLLKGIFGTVSDKIGKRSIFVVLGYGLSAIVKPLPGFFPRVTTVIFSRVFDRIGKGIRTAPRDALLAGYADGNTGAVFGFHRGMDTLGAVVGPLVALILLFIFPGNYTLIFIAAIIPSVCAVYFTTRVKDPVVKSGVVKEKFKLSRFWSLATPRYKSLLVLLTLFSFVNSSDVFLILKSMDVAKSDTMAIFGYIFYNFVYAAASYPIGLLADKIGKKNIFVIGMFIFSITYFFFALNDNIYLIWPLFALYGIYSASSEGVMKAWVSDLIPSQFRGSAIGLLTTLISIATMFGSIFTGILWDQYGAAVPFMISAIGSLIIAMLLILIKDKD